jgi:hypothetical protein
MPDDVRKALDAALQAFERYQRSGKLPEERQQQQGAAQGAASPPEGQGGSPSSGSRSSGR